MKHSLLYLAVLFSMKGFSQIPASQFNNLKTKILSFATSASGKRQASTVNLKDSTY